MQKNDFVIIGGDKRLSFTAENLIGDGYRVGVFANSAAAEKNNAVILSSLNEAMDSGDRIIFGIPFSRNGIIHAPLCLQNISVDEVAELVRPNHRIVGGMVGNFTLMCAKKGAVCADYGTREDFCLFNAVPTAEAVIAILTQKLPVTLWGSKILIMGYGRIGKALSQRLKLLGAEVTVTARKSTDFALAATNGISCVTTKPHIEHGRQYDAVINTIPQKILTDKSFALLRSDCLVIDVSAYPGYVSQSEASQYGIEVTGAFSLPGKTAPVTAGRIIADVVKNIFDELAG
ncbi:MAG: hypothetical protein IJ460_01120 [Clostridia bacterium]|nr:hypothetical protein [Clostridia bacterium]